MSASPYALVPLDAARGPEHGAKARNLARVAALGLAVPRAFVAPDRVFQRFLDDGGLRAPIAAILSVIDARDVSTVQAAAASIRALVLDAPLAPALRAALDHAREALGCGARLIVRSSGVGEDSADASFAGQLDSIPGVATAEVLERALRASWASYWSERSLAYQARRGVRLSGMGVIVQREIDALWSGVLFTRSPDSADDMLLEFCPGPGEALVSGRVDPGRLAVSRADLALRAIAAADAGTPAAGPDPSNLRALAQAALALEAAFGGAQDVEWCVDRDARLWLLQSRPITTAVRPAQAFWSNANIAENFPGPVSPLLYSIAAEGYRCYFRNLGRALGLSSQRIRAMEPALRQIIGAHRARLYYNLTNIHAVIRQAPFGPALAAAFDQFVGAPAGPGASPAASPAASPVASPVASPIASPVASPIARPAARPTRLRDLAALPRVALQTTWQYLFLPRRVAAFERQAAAFAARTHPAALRTRALPALADDLRGFLDIRFRRWTNAALADAAAMVCSGLLRAALRRLVPEENERLQLELLKGLPGLVSGVPVIAIWALSRCVREDPAVERLFDTESSARIVERLRDEPGLAPFRARFEAFLDEWGFRCPGELMLTVPSLQETPAAVVDLLQAYRRVEGESPQAALARHGAARERATDRLLEGLRGRALAGRMPSLRAFGLRLILQATYGAIRLRERARLKQALLYSRARRIALEIGERLAARGLLAAREDSFYFGYAELLELASGEALHPHHALAVAALRRRAEAEAAEREPPDAFTLAGGDYLPRAGASRAGAAAGGLAGTTACAGIATGRAAVLKDLSEARNLAAGDVLVACQTDPGWGPVFFLLKGLVLERGGMLSHGAILAREYGIPTVVGVAGATSRIPHGCEVIVDGDRGVVELAA